MALQYTVTHRNNDMSDLVTAAGATGYIIIYSGALPANVATADAGTILVALPCSATLGTVASGVLTFNAITTTAIATSGTAGHWRLCTSAAGTTCIAQGTVGTSGADLNLSTLTLTAAVNLSISSWTVTAFGA